MNKIKVKHRDLIIFIINLIIFSVVVYFLLKNEISTFDNTIYSMISKIQSPFLTYVFKFISFLCSAYVVVLLMVIYMLFTKDKKNGFYVGLNVLLCILLNQTVKQLFSRERPTLINLITEKGYSFPSGHAMVSLAFYGLFIYLINHKKINKKVKYIGTGCLIFLILFVGISRIYLGVHYASDVLGGYSLAMMYLILYIKLIYKKKMMKRN